MVFFWFPENIHNGRLYELHENFSIVFSQMTNIDERKTTLM